MASSLPILLTLVNSTRVLEDLATLRSFGATGGGAYGHGVSRPALSQTDLDARRWLSKRFQEAGLRDVVIDGMGSVHGHGGSDEAPALLMGSHSDTQPEGGWLDGALGVVYALEAARVLHSSGAPGAWAVANWEDEEGRFSTLTASKAFAEQTSVPWERHCARGSGVTLAEAAASANLTGVPVASWKDRAAGWLGYLEAHIEQGPLLERMNASLGIVSAIVGQVELLVQCHGQQNHAGTTRMRDRRDAALRAMQLGVELDAALHRLCEAEEGDDCSSVWTISSLSGYVSHSTIPGSANLTLQMRSPTQSYLDRMLELAHAIVAKTAAERVRCDAALSRAPSPATMMDAGLRACLLASSRAVATEDSKVLTMHSAALHDAAPLAAVMPSAMLFVPSIGGISHSFDEHTLDEDIALGAKAFVGTASSVLLGLCQPAGMGDAKQEL
jgi:N-carbamoyl-L-amino-acid hydrolase